MARTTKTTVKSKTRDVVAGFNKVASTQAIGRPIRKSPPKKHTATSGRSAKGNVGTSERQPKPTDNKESVGGGSINDQVFEIWDEHEFKPQDFGVRVPIDSLESRVGYSSLFRQLHQGFVRRVAFHRSPAGGSLSIEEARKAAFHACTSKEEAKEKFDSLMSLPVECLNFVDLLELHSQAPRVAERFWERVKREARKEFESGHLAANISFPVDYMKEVWNIARYIGVRESFIAEWNPQGGIELSLIDMLTQAYFQWQYWLEQTVKRSRTREREEHPAYVQWKETRTELNKQIGWSDGFWLRPTVTEEQALDQAIQISDRWNRIFMRTLRQLRDLRRYAPVTINTGQVNIAADGGNQVNIGPSQSS